MLQAEPGDQQASLLPRTQHVEVIDGFPELFRGHGEVFDDVHRIAQDPVNQRLDPRITGLVEQTAGLFEKLLGTGSVGNLDVHGGSSSCHYYRSELNRLGSAVILTNRRRMPAHRGYLDGDV